MTTIGQTKPSPAQIARAIVRSLSRCGDPRTAAQGRTFFKEPVELLGVGAQDLRRVAREFHRSLRETWELGDALALCEALLPDPRLDVKAAPLLLLERYADSFPPSLLPRIRRWIASGWCDAWSVIDTLCASVLGPLLERHPSLLARTRGWTSSSNLWLRRAAAVSLVKFARRGERLDAVYAVARRLLDDEEDIVQKACGWLLREAGRTDPRRLETFLRRHGPRVARTTLRYAIERFPAPARGRLLEESRARPIFRSR